MNMLMSFAALALGAAPVQARSPDQIQAGTGPARTDVPTQTMSASPTKPVWKPKLKPGPAPDVEKPAAGPAAPPKL